MAGALAFVALWALGRFVDLDKIADKMEAWEGGPHYRVDLVNDTEEPLEFTLCVDEGCESFAQTRHVKPGKSYDTLGEVGDPSWWLVRDQAGNLRGCFKIDFDREADGIDLMASQLQPCP